MAFSPYIDVKEMFIILLVINTLTVKLLLGISNAQESRYEDIRIYGTSPLHTAVYVLSDDCFTHMNGAL